MYGVSLSKIAQQVPDAGELFVMPTGTGPVDYEELFGSNGLNLSFVLTPSSNQFSTTFAPQGTIVAFKDLGENTGVEGSAFSSEIIDTFSTSAIPIPGALPLFATGLVGVWGLVVRRKRSKQRSMDPALAA